MKKWSVPPWSSVRSSIGCSTHPVRGVALAQGIRRTAYGGVVTLHKDGARIFVTPQGFTGI
jgi:hypothetical protein|eukprot:COSAG03_NODE_20_length_21605_cov_27.875523_26_plen_61_part_00